MFQEQMNNSNDSIMHTERQKPKDFSIQRSHFYDIPKQTSP